MSKFFRAESQFGKKQSSLRLGWIIKTSLLGAALLASFYLFFVYVDLPILRTIGNIISTFITGNLGALFILIFLLFSIFSYKNNNIRGSIAGAFIGIGLIFIRLGVSTFLSGEPLDKKNIIAQHFEDANKAIPAQSEQQKNEPVAVFQNIPVAAVPTIPSDIRFAIEKITDTASQAQDEEISLTKLKETVDDPFEASRQIGSVERLLSQFNFYYPTDPLKPIGATFEGAPSPFHKDKTLLQVRIKISENTQKQMRKWNLIFVVDMASFENHPEILPTFQKAVISLSQKMNPEDSIAILPLGNSDECILAPTNTYKQNEIQSAIQCIEAFSTMPGFSGLERAFAESSRSGNALNQIILISDGEFNIDIDNFDHISKTISADKPKGTALSVAAISTAPYNMNLMRQIAHKGEGRLYDLKGASELAKILDQATLRPREIIIKDISVKTELNPSLVTSVQPVSPHIEPAGNEYHFELPIKGAIEAGREYTLTYEMTFPPSFFASTFPRDIGVVKIKSMIEASGLQTEYTFPISSSTIKQSLEQASDTFRLVAAATGLGEIILHKKRTDSVNIEDLKKLVLETKDPRFEDTRKELLQLLK